MAKNICTLAIMSENATLLSEFFSNCKCFGIHVLIVFVCTATTHTYTHTHPPTHTHTKEKKRKVKLDRFHTELKNGLDKMIGTLSKL